MDRGPLQLFREGGLAMMRHGFLTLVELRRIDGLGEDTGAIASLQHPETGERADVATGVAYCINRESAVAGDAFKWLKFMSSREMGVQMFLGGHAEPGCRLTSWKDPRVLEEYPICAQISEAAEEAVPERRPWNLRVSPCYAAWNRHVAAMLNGDVTPEGAAAAIAAEIGAILDLGELGPQELP
jgi:hypothetical protein